MHALWSEAAVISYLPSISALSRFPLLSTAQSTPFLPHCGCRSAIPSIVLVDISFGCRSCRDISRYFGEDGRH